MASSMFQPERSSALRQLNAKIVHPLTKIVNPQARFTRL
jgi:hypothetical protein